MQIQGINRSDKEKVFWNVKNGSGATITTGMGVRWLGWIAGAEVVSNDGVSVIAVANAAAMVAFAGIAANDMASLDCGRIQAWGYCDSIMLSAEGTSISVGGGTMAETILKVSAVAGMFTSDGTALETLSTTLYKYVQVFNTTTISAQAWAPGFVRAL